MKNFILLFAFFFSISSTHVIAQVTQDWVKIYNGPGNNADDVSSMAIDDSGNVYITGGSVGIGTSYDYATIKYNTNGVQLWVERYNGPGNGSDEASAIAVDSFGNVYVTGSSWGSGTNYDYATIKYSANGVQQWAARYNGPADNTDRATSIAIDNLGNVYVTGSSAGIGTEGDFATIKYNSSGVQQWAARYNGNENYNDVANSIAVDNAGNVYVTGGCYDTVTSLDYVTIKYNPSGAQQWVAVHNASGNSYDNAIAIALDGSGNIYVTGRTGEYGTYFGTIKYNPSGVQQWIQIYQGPSNTSNPASMVVDDYGSVYVTGYSLINNSSDYATVKYNTNGVQQWVALYNGPANNTDGANSITLDSSRNVYVTGTSYGLGYAFATVKYNSSGVQQCVQRYQGGITYEGGISVKVDKRNNVYVTGYTGAADYSDYVTIKYSQPNAIQPISGEVPNNFHLKQNYPNPFNPSTNIEFDIPKKSFVKLVVYDLLGKEIETLLNGAVNSGSYKITWDASNFSSGIYYYTLISDKFRESRKMVYVK